MDLKIIDIAGDFGRTFREYYTFDSQTKRVELGKLEVVDKELSELARLVYLLLNYVNRYTDNYDITHNLDSTTRGIDFAEVLEGIEFTKARDVKVYDNSTGDNSPIVIRIGSTVQDELIATIVGGFDLTLTVYREVVQSLLLDQLKDQEFPER